MKNKQTDGEILNNVINHIGEMVTVFNKTVGFYSTTKSLYNILNDEAKLKESFILQIVKAYPQVNINYLRHGIKPVILDSSKAIGQNYVLNLENDTASFDNIPKDLRDIKNLLKEILDRLDK